MRIHWRRYLRPHHLLATCFIFLVMWLLSFVHVEHHFLDPFTHGIKDYDVTDIVYSRLRDTNRIEIEDRIVLVNTGEPDRARLSRMINRIEAAGPAVVGIDVLFEGRKDSASDAALQHAFQQYGNNIVLATFLDSLDKKSRRFGKEGGADPFFTQFTGKGFTNFPSNETKTIRYFSPEEEIPQGRATAFAVQIVKRFEPEALDALERRKKELERIHYSCTLDHFIRFEPETILDSSVNLTQALKGKIVLMGYLEDYTSEDPVVDRFFTPLNPRYSGRTIPDMYGVVLHANIVRMLLNGDYVRDAPRWLMLLFAFILVYANTFFFFWNYKYFWYKNSAVKVFYRWGHLVQVVEIAFLFLVTAWIFYMWRLKVDFTVAVVALLLAFDLCIVYYYLRQTIGWLGKVPDHFPVRPPAPPKPKPPAKPAKKRHKPK